VKVEDREVLVPFVRAIVPEVDVDAHRVVVTPPEGLFEEPPAEPLAESQSPVEQPPAESGDQASPDAGSSDQPG
jgi:16S rRNA processing protein RimM